MKGVSKKLGEQARVAFQQRTYQWKTDGRTDGQTDRQTTAATDGRRERERERERERARRAHMTRITLDRYTVNE